MFEFLKTFKIGQQWLYNPKFLDTDRGAIIEIVEVFDNVVKIKSISGRDFKELLPKDYLKECFTRV